MGLNISAKDTHFSGAPKGIQFWGQLVIHFNILYTKQFGQTDFLLKFCNLSDILVHNGDFRLPISRFLDPSDVWAYYGPANVTNRRTKWKTFVKIIIIGPFQPYGSPRGSKMFVDPRKLL